MELRSSSCPRCLMRRLLLAVAMGFLSLTGARVGGQEVKRAADGKDWPMYNSDVVGSRHNKGETALSAENVGRLEEKWRFPPRDADFQIGVIHATPIVVN